MHEPQEMGAGSACLVCVWCCCWQDILVMAAVSLMRDALLVLDPLSKPWVAQVHQAEAEFWKR
jgi:hypothetical protein